MRFADGGAAMAIGVQSEAARAQFSMLQIERSSVVERADATSHAPAQRRPAAVHRRVRKSAHRVAQMIAQAILLSVPAGRGGPLGVERKGENGSGKSTLIEALAMRAGLNPGGGTKTFTGRYRPSESSLHRFVRLARGMRRERAGFFLRAETMFNVSTEAEAYAECGWADLHEISHGEAFLRLALENFVPHGPYILDEPEAALSPQRQLSARSDPPAGPAGRAVRRLHALADPARVPTGDHLSAPTAPASLPSLRGHRALRGDQSRPVAPCGFAAAPVPWTWRRGLTTRALTSATTTRMRRASPAGRDE